MIAVNSLSHHCRRAIFVANRGRYNYYNYIGLPLLLLTVACISQRLKVKMIAPFTTGKIGLYRVKVKRTWNKILKVRKAKTHTSGRSNTVKCSIVAAQSRPILLLYGTSPPQKYPFPTGPRLIEGPTQVCPPTASRPVHVFCTQFTDVATKRITCDQVWKS